MQNRNDNHTNNRYHVTGRLSPFGYFVVGIVGFLVLILFGHILLPLAVIVGVGWLIWKFRWAIRYYFGQINRRVDDMAQPYRQRCRNDRHSRSNCSARWNPNAAGNDRNNVIIDVTPEKEDHS